MKTPGIMSDLAESAVMTPAARKAMQELEKRRYNTDHDIIPSKALIDTHLPGHL